MALKPDPLTYPPRLIGLDEAARYVGLGATKFTELVADGVLPKPKRLGRRVLWDRVQLDLAVTDLPTESEDVMVTLEELARRSGQA